MPAVNEPKYIIMHCTDSDWGSLSDVDQWHKQRGFDRIGYHYLIGNQFPTYRSFKDGPPQPSQDGRIYVGRGEADIGAHTIGMNSSSIGICLVGRRGTFTDRQFASARLLCHQIMERYGIPSSRVMGHRETPLCASGKTCPDFDPERFRESL